MYEQAIEQLAQAVRQLDARLRDVANFKPKLQAWQNATLINGWLDVGVPTSGPAGFWKDPHGLVYLRGDILQVGALPSVAFVLPVDYRPQFLVTAGAVDNAAGLGVLQIATNGNVDVRVASGGRLVLHVPPFRAFA